MGVHPARGGLFGGGCSWRRGTLTACSARPRSTRSPRTGTSPSAARCPRTCCGCARTRSGPRSASTACGATTRPPGGSPSCASPVRRPRRSPPLAASRSCGKRSTSSSARAGGGAGDAASAPTRVRPGSHRDAARVLTPAGDEGMPFSQAAQLAARASAARPTQLATGQAGDVIVCHPFLVHAASCRTRDGIRGSWPSPAWPCTTRSRWSRP
jgi:phytanoyl-CoA dioxygenase PhyH